MFHKDWILTLLGTESTLQTFFLILPSDAKEFKRRILNIYHFYYLCLQSIISKTVLGKI